MSASNPKNIAERKSRRLGQTLQVAGADVYLTPTEYRLLAAFRRQPDHVFARAELMALATPDIVVLDRTIDVHIKSLRRKIAAGPEQIETVYGVGYRLVRHESCTACRIPPI